MDSVMAFGGLRGDARSLPEPSFALIRLQTRLNHLERENLLLSAAPNQSHD